VEENMEICFGRHDSVAGACEGFERLMAAQGETTSELPARMAGAWAPAAWRDVHVLVGVSGGADSMALLRALIQLKAEAGGAGQLFVGHVNHQLRGEESHADEGWLREQCERLDVPLFVESVNTVQQAADDGDGVEAAAREGRYRALTRMAEGAGARYVAVAHTRDDQVETVLQRLLRGTGLRGLSGMPTSRMLSPSVTLVRPMLACRRSDVLEYLAAIGQSHRQDATNEAVWFTRNRLRHECYPTCARITTRMWMKLCCGSRN
jgi:tRNA(Ile)-lysidine synthase